ncbi:hypothetical protein DITRI_Ditri09bG0122900 [Diplodiscus trichospermus]
MEWLERCAMGQLRDHSNLRLVHKWFYNANIKCSICLVGGVTVAIIFYSKVEMEAILSDANEMLDEWFKDLWPWRLRFGPKKIALWVKLEGIPLDTWHPEFFMFLANRWGTFIKMDDQSFFKKKFDFARILVLVGSKDDIPFIVNVKFKGISIKILTSVEDYAVLLTGNKVFGDQHGMVRGFESSAYNLGKVKRQKCEKRMSIQVAGLDP